MIDGVSKTIIDDTDNHIDSFKSNDREDNNDPQEWQNIVVIQLHNPPRYTANLRMQKCQFSNRTFLWKYSIIKGTISFSDLQVRSESKNCAPINRVSTDDLDDLF